MSRFPRLSVAATGLLLVAGLTVGSTAAHADPDGSGRSGATGAGAASSSSVPSEDDVRAAQDAAAQGERDVAAVRADLDAAQGRLTQAQSDAARAAEAWNGARYEAQQARRDLRAAQREVRRSERRVETLRDAYARTLVVQGSTNPELAAYGAMTRADGVSELIDAAASYELAADVVDGAHTDLLAAEDDAAAVRADAAEAEERATAAAERARTTRDEAQAAADAAAEETTAIAARRDALVRELARLQDVSVAVAAERQDGLERRRAAREAAAEERRREREQREQRQEEREQEEQAPDPAPSPDPAPDPEPTPTPDPEPEPDPEPDPAPAPAPSQGAQAAIAFARSQLGDPYRWGAAGPDSWDCSGLTAGAWAAGGKSLPHYSVAQYEQSTPISAGDIRPGDLLFWGDTSDPSSIFHVALYVGDGMMIHAPRTGRPVVEESMYYWIPPTFYARP